jgi:hypothetical protein
LSELAVWYLEIAKNQTAQGGNIAFNTSHLVRVFRHLPETVASFYTVCQGSDLAKAQKLQLIYRMLRACGRLGRCAIIVTACC